MIKWLAAALGGSARLREESETEDPFEDPLSQGDPEPLKRDIRNTNTWETIETTPRYSSSYPVSMITKSNVDYYQGAYFPFKITLQFDIPSSREGTEPFFVEGKFSMVCNEGTFVTSDDPDRTLGEFTVIVNSTTMLPSITERPLTGWQVDLCGKEGIKYRFIGRIYRNGSMRILGRVTWEIELYQNRVNVHFCPSDCELDHAYLKLPADFLWRLQFKMTDYPNYRSTDWNGLIGCENGTLGYYHKSVALPIEKRYPIGNYGNTFHNNVHFRLYAVKKPTKKQ